MTDEALVTEFDTEMMRIYQRALSEANYKATRFLHMLHEHRGLETARILIHSAHVSEGYTALWERGCLDLTVEAVITTTKSGILCSRRKSWLYEKHAFNSISISSSCVAQQAAPWDGALAALVPRP